MTAPENAPPVELVDAAVNAWFAAGPRAALTRDQQEHFRERMRAALAAVGFLAPAAGDARDALPPLDDDLIEILGRPNFACGELATLLRAGGHVIKNKAEHEQAAVIYFLLGYYLKHGSAWHEHVGEAFEAIAAQQGKVGEA
ncbi:hypothetical protein [Achromobacter piechaudii]|uniref:Uncharacterized protein n=1 Tax=Achromobacter piechaudii TaxID=72556 RepID=A0ABN7F036_9BURK|nr:hypothetical protein [Achromobacter piechaudii]CAB3705235.1 hypothetical protein LMG1873_02895 [Achromobacter piechaudii]CAB3959711.1 hypothetical protein LMG6103_05894 [Achromobacter piechaudii]